jgi:hypothetical protein
VGAISRPQLGHSVITGIVIQILAPSKAISVGDLPTVSVPRRALSLARNLVTTVAHAAGRRASRCNQKVKEESGILCLCGQMNTAEVQSYTGYHFAPEYQWPFNFLVLVQNQNTSTRARTPRAEGGYKAIPGYSVSQNPVLKGWSERKDHSAEPATNSFRDAMRVPSTRRPGLAALGFGQ